MARHQDSRPAHHRIAASIRADIMSGDLAPGEQLPITQQLIERFGVSNQTVQRALQLLKAEGLIVGRSGRGVFVRETALRGFDSVGTMAPSGEGEPYSVLAQAAQQATRGMYRILDVREVVPPVQVREAFGLRANGTALLRYRLLLLDDDPAELVWSYYPMGIARGTALMDRRRIKGGSPTLLTGLGFPPREMVDTVTWRAPTEEEFVTLELPTGVPVSRTFRVVSSDDARPIEATVIVQAGHLQHRLYRVTL
ncbi:GntR family transcriptional regulator [Streptomyces sp. B6B3]|uniref:GntR family transcriptional regulator n=1 Tax=Streptomyces sp. B6B3 TaxID=3153570 RepID=UPI00325DFB31